MQNLIEFLLNRIVEHPDEVVVESSQKGDIHHFIIHVHPEDMGRVIGKKGSVINSIRTIAKVRAIKEGIRFRIDIAEAE